MVASEMLNGFKEIFSAPFVDFSVMWLLIPLFMLWLVLEIYFDIYKSEKLGWNTALGNAISLLWIDISMMRELFSRPSLEVIKFLGLLGVLVYSCIVIYIIFKHKIPAKYVFLMGSPTLIYYIAGVIILWATGALEITPWVLLDLVILFAIISVLVFVLKKVVPGKEEFGGEMGEDFGLSGEGFKEGGMPKL